MWNRFRLLGNDDGFTLIEAVVAFVVFSVIAVSATAAIANSISVSSTTRNRIAATNLAQQAIAKARADQTSLETTPNATTISGQFTVARTATIPVTGIKVCPAGSSIPLTVQVTWTDAGKTRTVRMDTVVAC